MKVREVLPGVFALHLPLPLRPSIVNVYLLDGGGEWLLVDTGVHSRESLVVLEDALEEIGCPPQRISVIACTHHHPDHFGNARALKELTGARVFIHKEEWQRAQRFAPAHTPEVTAFFRRSGIPLERIGPVPSAREFWQRLYAPCAPDGFFADGTVLRVGTLEVRAVWTPGHTPGHCVMYLPERRLLIAGDHLLPKITPHVGWYPSGPADPLGDFLASQEKIQRLDVDLVLPAHGAVFADHRRRARQIIHHHMTRLREMYDIVRARPSTAYEVASQSFGFDIGSPVQIQFPATFETLAHLEYLRQRGQVVREDRDGAALYRAAADADRRLAGPSSIGGNSA